ncbi:MAG TPA: hypothetical protein VKA05_07670, partial [Acidimicrobiales bacterium]|nr:hypothetical protein [Acidimicrobiales bacterium]
MGWFRRTPPHRPGVADEVTPADPGWRGVDPISPTLSRMPSVVDTAAFEAGLPSRGIPQWVRPLTHGRSGAAPSGLADGIVSLSTAVEPRRTGLVPLDVAPAPVDHDDDGPPPVVDDRDVTTPSAGVSSVDAGPPATPAAAAPVASAPVVARVAAPGSSPAAPLLGATVGPAAAAPPVPSVPVQERDS